MKANDFLKLVEKMMTAQADYYAISRKFGAKSQEAITALIKARELEKQARTVIKEGRLEPDELTATVQVFTTEAFQEELRLINAASLQKQLELDFPGGRSADY